MATRSPKDFPASFLKSVRVLAGLLIALTLAAAVHESEAPTTLGRWSAPYSWILLLLTGLSLLSAVFALPGPAGLLYRKRGEIILLVLSAAGGLAFLEFAVRLIDPGGISYYEHSTAYHVDKIPDPDTVYKHRPSHHAVYGPTELRTNSFGLRDHEFSREKPDEEMRILLLGDSVTLGSGVPAESTFCARMERTIQAQSPGPVEVINSGVGSYNTEQELAYLKKEGMTFSPDLVLLLYVINDLVPAVPFEPERELSFRGKSVPGKLMLLLKKSWVYRMIHHSIRYGALRRPGRGAPPVRSPDPGVDERAAPNGSAPSSPGAVADPEGWAASRQALVEIATISKEGGVNFALFFWHDHSGPKYLQLLELIRITGGEEGFPVIDSRPWFEGRDLSTITNSTIDSHPNSRGHALVAEQMIEALVRLGLL